MRKYLKITFESDWHVGSGAGIPGSVDRMVLRDDIGLPCIPGKTLTGLLRDSAEFIASVRDRSGDGPKWDGTVSALFGSQSTDETRDVSSAKIGIGSARFSKTLRDLLKGNEGLLPFLFMVQPGVRIDRETGRSQEKHLYSREEARGGCVLYAEITGFEELGEEEKGFFEDILRATRRVGGKRRRGGGKCAVELADVNERDRIAGTEAFRADLRDAACPQSSWVELEYRLETIQPVIVNRATLGNVVESESFIPGTFLLPFFTGEIFARDEKLSKTIQQDVLNGAFSVGPFLPEADGEAAYPVPLSYAQEKDDKKRAVNRLVEVAPEDTQMKDIRSGFIVPSGGSVKLASAESGTIFRTHNTVDDGRQRPTKDTGGVFTYQAIKAGLVFRGTVRISAALWREIQGSEKDMPRVLSDEHFTAVGQSRKDEYGLVRITYAGISDGGQKLECADGLIEGKYLAVYLMSDTLIRGKDTLSYTASLDDFREALSEKLGVTLHDVVFHEKNDIGGDRGHCVRAGRRESWHGKWQLPRPSLVFLRGGSVLLFELKEPNKLDGTKCVREWNRSLLSGLGDRVGEGYGRVILNPSFLCGQCAFERIPPPKAEARKEQGVPALLSETGAQPGGTGLLDKEDAVFFDFLLDEYIRETYRKHVRGLVEAQIKGKTLFEGLPWTEGERPRASQFGILRELAAAISSAGDTRPLESWLKSLERRSPERQMWSEEWRTWLGKIAADPSFIWAVSDFDARCGLSGALKSRMRIFAVCTLLDILCEAVFDNKGGAQ